MRAKHFLKMARLTVLSGFFYAFVFVMRASADETLLACWPLTNGTENIVSDGSAGVLCGNAVFLDGALELDGSGAYVRFPGVPVVTGSVSVSVWVRPDEDNRLMRLLGRFQVSGDNRDCCLFLGKGNRLWTFISDNGTLDAEHAILRTTQEPAASVGAWTHLAMTWDATLGTTGLLLYANGKELATVDAQTADIHGAHAGTADLTLGTYDLPTDAGRVACGMTNTFKGAMCWFAFFDLALSAEDVATLYAGGRGANAALTPATEAKSNIGPIITTGGSITPVGVTGQSPVVRTSAAGVMALGSSGTVYVNSGTGNDSYDGSAAAFVSGVQGPKRSIAAAKATAKATGFSSVTISMQAGTYVETNNIWASGGQNFIYQSNGNVIIKSN